MNYVAIDPSLSCTAMVVNDKKFVYTTTTVAYTKKGELKRWFKECEEQGVTIRVYDDLPSNINHNELEVLKVIHYKHICKDIRRDISDNERTDVEYTQYDKRWTIAIEGYSYSSAAGPLIDLVTFGTTLRQILYEWLPFDKIPYYVDLLILQPTEVKQRSAMLVYSPIKKGKKVEYRNPDGVAGGSFKKPEIYKALLHNNILKDDGWIKFLQEHSEEILEMKSIPKPIEDINDAKTLYEIIKSPQPLNK